MPTAYAKRKRALELSERLNALDEFKALPQVHENICMLHVKDPTLRKEDIAERLGLSSADVYAFFHSEKWEAINTELAKQQLRELVQKAIKTLDECLNDKKGAVRLQAAASILINAHLLEKEPKTVKHDNKLVVVWNDPRSEGIKKLINGNQDSVCSASETNGSARVAGPL